MRVSLPVTLGAMTPHTEQERDAFGAWERSAWEVRAAPYAASLGDLTRGSIVSLPAAAVLGAATRAAPTLDR